MTILARFAWIAAIVYAMLAVDVIVGWVVTCTFLGLTWMLRDAR